MFGHILKCAVVPREKIHERTFLGAGIKMKRSNTRQRAKRVFNRKKSNDQYLESVAKSTASNRKKQAKLTALGIDYAIPVANVSVTFRLPNISSCILWLFEMMWFHN